MRQDEFLSDSPTPANPVVWKQVIMSRQMGSTVMGNFMGKWKELPTGNVMDNNDVTNKSFHYGSTLMLPTQKYNSSIASIDWWSPANILS